MMRRIITMGIALIVLMSTFAVNGRANASNAFTDSAAQDSVVKAGLAQGAHIAGRELVYPNGIMVSIDAGTPGILIACSAGYTCLYEGRGFTGRRLQWRDHGQVINLPDYGFNDQMSSWINNNNVDARWFYNNGASGTTRCMQPNTSVSWVGSGDNDEASSLAIYTDNFAC